MRRIGVYVHFPWCLKKCPYCDFVSYASVRDAIPHEAYATAVIAELERRRAAFEGARLESVFFGGGTPSLWQPSELGRVLAAILERAHDKANEVEVTVECNPTSLDEERARALIAAGVNRLSVGVQGLDKERLKFLGRLHEPDGGLAALDAAIRAGVPRVSGDLIYGVATNERSEGALEAADEAVRVARTGVGHVSAYSLTIEAGTQFGELARKNRLPLAEDDLVADTFLAIDEALAGEGFAHYEVSNYAKPGQEARHNLGYWRGDDYLGLGCAAYGTIGERRYRNLTSPERYVEAASGAGSTESDVERLDAETRLRERIMLGLRLKDGFDLEGSARELGVDPWPASRKHAADKLLARGRLVIDAGVVRVPHAAWSFADGIAADLF